jgi:hypothetical protein
MKAPIFKITREKHLDHMVKVVPFIVLIYGIQSYVLWKIDGPISGGSLLVLGCLLVTMIGSFLVYDLKHQVLFFEDHLEIEFLGLKKSLNYSDIMTIETSDPSESFGSLHLKANKKSIRLYFVDDVGKIKEWILNQKSPEQLAA